MRWDGPAVPRYHERFPPRGRDLISMPSAQSQPHGAPGEVMGDVTPLPVSPGLTMFGMEVEPVLFVSFDGRIRRANATFCKLLGCPERAITGKPFLDFVHPEDRAATSAEFEGIAHGAKTLYFENRWRRCDGDFLWLQWKAEAKPEHRLVVGIARDVTHLRKAASDGDISQTLTYVVDKLHAIENRTREFQGLPIRPSTGAQAELDAAAAGLKKGVAWWKWAIGAFGAIGAIFGAVFGAGQIWARTLDNNATKDDLVVHTEKDLAPVVERVNLNTEEIGEVKNGVGTLVERGEKEAQVVKARRAVDKYQAEYEVKLSEYTAAKARGRNPKRPTKEPEHIAAELALEDAEDALGEVSIASKKKD
jgi:PAS domain S-box-containing protein